jgi:hypothetical protein
LPAQQSQSTEKRSADLKALKIEALQHPVAYRLLSELSDGIGPRLTGSAQDARAGEWALETMRAIGLQNVHPEPWTMERGWQRGIARAHLMIPFPLDLSVTSYGWAGSTAPGGAEADVVRVNSNALREEARDNAPAWEGKVLLATPKDPKASDMLKTMSELPGFLAAAREAGAILVLLRDTRPGLMLPHTGPLSFPGRSSILPVLDIAEEHEALILRILGAGKPVRVRVDVQNSFTAGAVVSNNIVGEIPGSEHPEQVVVLGGHLDSWDLGTGSIDDGFGVAAVLGAAKSILASGALAKRTIRFVLFTGEEQGLLGSRAYTQKHHAELDNFVCAIILDWGNGPIKKFVLGGHIEFSGPLDELFGAIQDVGPPGAGDGYLTYTDAYAFTLSGVPAIAAFQDSPNYTLVGHSAADTLDKVNADILNRDSALLALSAVWLASYPARIGTVWSPAKTAEMLKDQRTALRALGLWPFPD